MRLLNAITLLKRPATTLGLPATMASSPIGATVAGISSVRFSAGGVRKPETVLKPVQRVGASQRGEVERLDDDFHTVLPASLLSHTQQGQFGAGGEHEVDVAGGKLARQRNPQAARRSRDQRPGFFQLFHGNLYMTGGQLK